QRPRRRRPPLDACVITLRLTIHNPQGLPRDCEHDLHKPLLDRALDIPVRLPTSPPPLSHHSRIILAIVIGFPCSLPLLPAEEGAAADTGQPVRRRLKVRGTVL